VTWTEEPLLQIKILKALLGGYPKTEIIACREKRSEVHKGEALKSRGIGLGQRLLRLNSKRLDQEKEPWS